MTQQRADRKLHYLHRDITQRTIRTYKLDKDYSLHAHTHTHTHPGLPLFKQKKIPDFSRRNCTQYVEQMHIY